MPDKPIRSPGALPLELHLISPRHNVGSDDSMALEDLGLEMRHTLLHADGADHPEEDLSRE